MQVDLMPWQVRALCGQLAADSAGDLIFRESLVSTARQQGKTVALSALIGWWLTDLAAVRGKPQNVLSTAHKLDRAEAIFNVLAPILVEYFGAKALKPIGRKEVTLPNGSRWEIRAATPSNAHGGSNDLIVCDEIWNIAPAVIFDALRPSQIARRSPLLSMWSTAGDESSVAMLQLREQAVNAIDKSQLTQLYFAEWSLKPGADTEDRSLWAMANPALGTTVTMSALEAAAASPDKASFMRAHLNLWISAQGAWLPHGLWDQCLDQSPMPAGGILAIDNSVDESRYVGIRAVQVEGVSRVCVEFVTDTEAKCWDQVQRVMADPAVKLAVTPTLELHLPANLGRRYVTVGYAELLKYTSLVRSMILEGQVTHTGEQILAEHIGRAVLVKTVQGAVLSSQKSPGPIELARCMVWAISLGSKPAKGGRPVFIAAPM
jgi:phage terminase large subunit-like protein